MLVFMTVTPRSSYLDLTRSNLFLVLQVLEWGVLAQVFQIHLLGCPKLWKGSTSQESLYDSLGQFLCIQPGLQPAYKGIEGYSILDVLQIVEYYMCSCFIQLFTCIMWKDSWNTYFHKPHPQSQDLHMEQEQSCSFCLFKPCIEGYDRNCPEDVPYYGLIPLKLAILVDLGCSLSASLPVQIQPLFQNFLWIGGSLCDLGLQKEQGLFLELQILLKLVDSSLYALPQQVQSCKRSWLWGMSPRRASP